MVLLLVSSIALNFCDLNTFLPNTYTSIWASRLVCAVIAGAATKKQNQVRNELLVIVDIVFILSYYIRCSSLANNHLYKHTDRHTNILTHLYYRNVNKKWMIIDHHRHLCLAHLPFHLNSDFLFLVNTVIVALVVIVCRNAFCFV